MDITTLTDETLRQLVSRDAPPCVSIYIPLDPASPQQEQTRIRLKNQLSRVERALDERGVPAAEVEATLKPIRAVDGTAGPARSDTTGLALLRSQERFETLELPDTTPELGIVNDQLFITPLLPFVNVNERFRVLALSQNEVRVFQGNRYAFAELSVPDLPTNIDAALQDDDNQDETLQFHTEATETVGDRPAVFHGQVVGDEHVKERVTRFCQMVASALDAHFTDQDVPMILLAAEPVPGIYRQASSYKNLLDEVVNGDHRQMQPAEIHSSCWKIVEPLAQHARDQALAQFREGLSKDRATTDVASALDAARVARVGTLLVGRAQRAASGGASQPESGPREEINCAVVETLRHGGEAFEVPQDELPEGAQLGAVYRY